MRVMKNGWRNKKRKWYENMEKKLIYMDNAATTPVKPEVLDAMLPYFTEKFGNPSSIYSISSENKKAITDAREVIAKTINTTPENIYLPQAVPSLTTGH